MTNIKVMTFNLKNDMFFTRKNLRWDTRRDYVRNLIRSAHPDIIGVQELSEAMRNELKVLLPQYQFVGQARGKQKSWMNEHSDILFLKKKFRLIEEKTFWLSHHPDQIGSRTWTSFFPRICTMVYLQDRKSSLRLRVFNTHLDPVLAYTRNFEIRTIIAELQKFQNEQNCPLILVGDLNTTQNSSALKMLISPVNELHLKSVYESQDVFNTFHYGNGKVKKDHLPIDYIYVSDGFDVFNTRIITTSFNGLYPSDHYPVIAGLQWKGKSCV